MELFEAIKNRRSIRSFLNIVVPADVLNYLFEAAIEAPSPKNSQPYKFVVYDGQAKASFVSKISALVFEEFERGKINTGVIETIHVIEQAPVLVLVYNSATSRYEKELFPITARMIDVQSIGASIQNLLLAAHAKGLGSLWVCDLLDVRPVVEMLESDHEIVAAVALGYPAKDSPRPPRKSLSEVVFWGGDEIK